MPHDPSQGMCRSFEKYCELETATPNPKLIKQVKHARLDKNKSILSPVRALSRHFWVAFEAALHQCPLFLNRVKVYIRRISKKLGGRYNKDYCILGSILGSPSFWELP